MPSHIDSEVRALIDDFARQPDVTPEQARNLQTAIEGSPLLHKELDRAVVAGFVKAIRPLNPHVNAGGEYNDAGHADIVEIPLAALTGHHAKLGEARLTLGHELQHALNSDSREKTYATLRDELSHTLASSSLPHDLTPSFDRFLDARQRDESSAQIAGFNAVVSALQHKQHGGAPTLAAIYKADSYRMQDFIVVRGTPGDVHYELKPGLHLNPDMTLSPTPENLAAVGKYFFYKPAAEARLGPHGKSDYRNYYGAFAVSEAVQLDRYYGHSRLDALQPDVSIDMARLGLSVSQLESNDLDFRRSRDDFVFIDSSHGLSTQRVLAATGRAQSKEPLAPDLGFADPAHPDHALYQDLRGRIDAPVSADHMAQIVLAAKQGDLRAGEIKGIGIVNDTTLWIAGNRPGDRAVIDLSQPPPAMRHTLQQAQAYDQQQARQWAQFQARQQEINARAMQGHALTVGSGRPHGV